MLAPGKAGQRSAISVTSASSSSVSAKITPSRASLATSRFLASDAALEPYLVELNELDATAQKADTVTQLNEPLAGMQQMAAGLDMLSGLMASLSIDDATERTRIGTALLVEDEELADFALLPRPQHRAVCR